MTWIRKEVLEGIPELPRRVDFDDWNKERGLVNLLSDEKNSKPWFPAGLIKGPREAGCAFWRLLLPVKGVSQAVWLEKPKVRVKVCTQAI